LASVVAVRVTDWPQRVVPVSVIVTPATPAPVWALMTEPDRLAVEATTGAVREAVPLRLPV
jgi:hypothetical protein